MTAPPLENAPFPASGDAPVLVVEGVSATFVEQHRRLQVLNDVSLALEQNEFVSIVGPSGSGKTTLLDIISGLIEPDEGAVLLTGARTTAAQRLGESAYMHQRDLLLPWRSALDNAALGLEVQGTKKRSARVAARERFPAFGLAGFEEHYPAQLSGGMRQRVAFLRTLLTGQSLVLLDEPFGALDALTRAISQAWLQSLLAKNPRSVLLVTHDVEEAIFLSDRILVLSERPGTVRYVETIDVPRPRPRDFLTAPGFGVMRARLLGELGLVDLPNEAAL
jgi:ABC-type nitrate/sulfonate/bicarbonate transport system ATPase subunit